MRNIGTVCNIMSIDSFRIHTRIRNTAEQYKWGGCPREKSFLCDSDFLEFGLGHTADRTEVGIVEFTEWHELLVVIINVSANFASVNCHVITILLDV